MGRTKRIVPSRASILPVTGAGVGVGGCVGGGATAAVIPPAPKAPPMSATNAAGHLLQTKEGDSMHPRELLEVTTS